MIRKCEGQDETLCRRLDDGSYVPCDCSLVFDDVSHSVIYPHDKFLSREEASTLRENVLNNYFGDSR